MVKNIRDGSFTLFEKKINISSAKSLLEKRIGPHTYGLQDSSSYSLALLVGIADAAEKLLHLAFLGASIWGAVNFFGKCQ